MKQVLLVWANGEIIRMKNIRRLAEIGEEELKRRIEGYVRDVYIEGLPQEKENLVGVAYGMNLGLYLVIRREFIECGLNPTEYDNQIRVCLKELDLETESLDRMLKK